MLWSVSLYFTYLHIFLKLTHFYLFDWSIGLYNVRFFFFILKTCILLAVPGLLSRAGFSQCSEQTHSQVWCLAFLITAASLAVKHSLIGVCRLP